MSSPRKSLSQSQSEYGQRLKMRVIAGYGGKCQCPGGCACAVPEFLTIDHIDNDGKADRKVRGYGVSFYRWLLKNGCPKENYRILCYNCNCGRAKTRDKRCPHETITTIRPLRQRGSVTIRKRKHHGDVWIGKWKHEGRHYTRILGTVSSMTKDEAKIRLLEYVPRSITYSENQTKRISSPEQPNNLDNLAEVLAVSTKLVDIPTASTMKSIC
jgi:hypothetical protein